MTIVFVNYTNHRSDLWSDTQREAAMSYGSGETKYDIVDVPFADVDPEGDEAYIFALADRETEKILACNPIAVLCQGEMTLCFAIVQKLIEQGIPVLSACTHRIVSKYVDPDRSAIKQSQFVFSRFRQYRIYSKRTHQL